MLATAVILAAILLPQTPHPAAIPAQAPPASDLTLPPETASTVTILEGRGVQLYKCTAQPAGYQWVSAGPEAQLFNLATGKVAGHHTAGPSWILDDGSSVRGTTIHTKPASNPADVPWLLMQAQPVAIDSSGPRGTLSTVSYVRRYNTHGGAAPAAGCDAGQVGQSLRVPYSATYGFYAMPGAPSNTQTAPGAPAPAPPPPQ